MNLNEERVVRDAPSRASVSESDLTSHSSNRRLTSINHQQLAIMPQKMWHEMLLFLLGDLGYFELAPSFYNHKY